MKGFRAFLCLLLAMLLPLSAVAEELIMFCHSYQSELNRFFQQAYPDVTVRLSSDGGQTSDFDQVLLDMVSRNYVYDLFKLPFSSGEARRLGDRGYLTDLNGSEIIREAVAQMPEGIRQRVTNAKGEVFALPFELSPTQSLMAFNTEIGEALGIEKPRTWAELLELIDSWTYDYADEADKEGYRLIDSAYVLKPERILERMIDAYISVYADGRLISFSTPEFTALMRSFERCRQSLADLEDPPLMEGSNLWQRTLIITGYPLLADYDTADMYQGVFEPMALSVTDDPDEAVIAVDMEALSISAGAPHAELAMTYAENLAASMDDLNRILLQGGSDDTPVEWAHYASQKQDYLDWIAEAEQAIEDGDEEAESLTELIEAWREELTIFEARRYEYTSESIRQYAALAPCLRPMPAISYQYYDSQQNTRRLLSSFVDGSMAADQFIREFDHVQSMMNLEDQ